MMYKFMTCSYCIMPSIYRLQFPVCNRVFSILISSTDVDKPLVNKLYLPDILNLNPKNEFYTKIRKCSYSAKLSNNKVQTLGLYDDELAENETAKLSDLSEDFDVRLNTKDMFEKQEQLLKTKLISWMERAEKMSSTDWEHIKTSVLEMQGNIDEENFDAIVMNKCSEMQCLPLGQSFFRYLKSTGQEINRATYGSYLRLFYNCATNCTDKDLEEIFNVYKELTHKYPMLDSYTIEKAICALSITKHWKEYKKLFTDIEKVYYPSLHVYSVVIKAAFLNQEFDLGWSLLEDLQYRYKCTPEGILIFWLQVVESRKRDDDLTRLLNFCHKFNIKPTLNLCDSIKETFVKVEIGNNRRGEFTTVLRSGECKNCRSMLQPAFVSETDFDELKATFLNRDLIGKDLFLKTKPEEFSEFLDFIEKTAPYNVVLDGLNIALNLQRSRQSHKMAAFQLKSVVKHFVTRNKKVLVLGRKHLNKLPLEDMKYVYDNANVFFTENISQDDPFLLYAAMYSGLGTQFVSRDMMRGHKFMLDNPKIESTFQKWQAQHQLFLSYIENNGTVHLQEPIHFMQNVQRNIHGGWHIPYTNTEVQTPVDNRQRHWLCLVKQPPDFQYKKKRTM